MEENHEHEKACERYLLGEMSEQEQAQLEQTYFADDAFFERFLAVKDDLMDAYARGDLAGKKRERFEQHFLASEPRRQQFEESRWFIRAATAASANPATENMNDSVDTAASRSWWPSTPRLFAGRPLVWQGALAVLLLVALAGTWVLVRQFRSRRAEREQAQNEEGARRRQEEERGRSVVPPVNASAPPSATPSFESTPPSKPADKHPLQPVPAQVASLFLSPFSPRDAAAANSLMLHSETREVVLHLAIKADDYRRYDVVLRTVDGNQVLSRRGLRSTSSGEGKSVALTLEPAIFDRQDYIVTLSGLTASKLETIGDYYFRVERSTSPARR